MFPPPFLTFVSLLVWTPPPAKRASIPYPFFVPSFHAPFRFSIFLVDSVESVFRQSFAVLFFPCPLEVFLFPCLQVRKFCGFSIVDQPFLSKVWSHCLFGETFGFAFFLFRPSPRRPSARPPSQLFAIPAPTQTNVDGVTFVWRMFPTIPLTYPRL